MNLFPPRRRAAVALAAVLPLLSVAAVAIAAPPAAKKTAPKKPAASAKAKPAAKKPPAAATTTQPVAAAGLTAGERETLAALSEETIKQVTADLTRPEFEGRGTAQPGGEKAAAYLADRFKALGLKPLGDAAGTTYRQSIPFTVTTLNPASNIKAGDATLTPGADFVPLPLPFESKPNASGEVVFVGYGVQSDELKRDDLKGIDVRGKVVIILSGGPPKGVDAAAWQQATGGGQGAFQKLIFGGAAAVLIANAGAEGQPYALLADYLTRPQARVGRGEQPAPPIPIPPLVMLGDAGAEKLLAGSGTTYADLKAKAEAGENVSRALNKTATLDVRREKTQGTGSNVVGLLEGSDPRLKNEAVVLTAHYDGWGKGADGRVFTGAADNALGVAEMLAIAEALSKSPTKPRRSFVFLAVTGEEHGLLGAQSWARSPTFPLDKIAANLNFDGIGSEIWGPVKVVTGYGAEYSELGGLFQAAAAANGLSVVPDPMPEERAWERSDHVAFVNRGIPALMILGGQADVAATAARARTYLKTDYHQPADVIRPDWDWSGAKAVASVMLLVGHRAANADARPKWLPAGAKYEKKGTPAARPNK